MDVSVALTAALISTGLISLLPNIILLLSPNYGTGEGVHSSVLSLGQAMAAGGLIGDVFLHTIPHAHSTEEAGLWLIGGFVIFLVADMIIRSFDDHHNHHHQHQETSQHKDERESSKGNNQENGTDSTWTTARVPASAILNLAGDAMHNFTDGLSIGVSFTLQSSLVQHDATVINLLSSRGVLAAISIFLHEIPHELGDFSSLVKAGVSKRDAILLQFATALAALVGTIVGVFAVESYGGDHLLFVTAGGFLYLAAVTILPEVLEDGKSFKFQFLQLLSFLTGIAFLYAVALLEHHDHDHSLHHGHSHHDHHGEHDHHFDHHQHHQHSHLNHHEPYQNDHGNLHSNDEL